MASEQKYKTIVTDIGRAKIAAAALHGTQVNVVEAAVGDGGGAYYLPTEDMTALHREVWRGDIADKQINASNPNMLDVKIMVDGAVGGFTIRELGIFDDVGDLIAVCNTPDTEKALIMDGAAATLTLIMHIVFSNAETLEFTINPTVNAVTQEELEAAIALHTHVSRNITDLSGEITEDSTATQIPSAKAVYDALGDVAAVLRRVVGDVA